ncbi:hypothetical protein MASR1M74_27680 [Lentimicrobium sp.]
MTIFDKIRFRLGKRWVFREQGRIHRKVKTVNLKDARQIAVLYSLDSEEEYEKINRFVSLLHKQGKKVSVIGTYKYRKLPAYYQPKLAYDLITPVELDFMMRPKAKFVSEFLEHPFDMLINLGSPKDFPLYYLVSLSIAGFKLGQKKGIEPWPYDLMIDADTENTDNLIEQLVHYTSSFAIGSKAG